MYSLNVVMMIVLTLTATSYGDSPGELFSLSLDTGLLWGSDYKNKCGETKHHMLINRTMVNNNYYIELFKVIF